MSAEQPRRHPVGFAANLLADSAINRLRSESSEDLLDAGATLVDETGRTPIGGARLILTVQATRATHTYESVIALCKVGRGVQAAMLNRSLLDDALDVAWVVANPDAAPALADDHEELVALGERSLQEKLGLATAPLGDAERSRLADLVKTYRGFHRSWTLASDDERLGLAKDAWGASDEAHRYLDVVYELIQRQNNTLLHGAPTALAVAMTPGRRQPNRIGPDAWWPSALGHGALAYMLVLRVIAAEFGLSKDDAADAFN